MTAIIKTILYAFVVIGVAYFVPGITVVGFWPAAVIVGLIMALGNAIIRALFPDNLLFGVLAVVGNAVLLWYLGTVISGFGVATYTGALLGGLIVAIAVWIIHEIF